MSISKIVCLLNIKTKTFVNNFRLTFGVYIMIIVYVTRVIGPLGHIIQQRLLILLLRRQKLLPELLKRRIIQNMIKGANLEVFTEELLGQHLQFKLRFFPLQVRFGEAIVASVQKQKVVKLEFLVRFYLELLLLVVGLERDRVDVLYFLVVLLGLLGLVGGFGVQLFYSASGACV